MNFFCSWRCVQTIKYPYAMQSHCIRLQRAISILYHISIILFLFTCSYNAASRKIYLSPAYCWRRSEKTQPTKTTTPQKPHSLRSVNRINGDKRKLLWKWSAFFLHSFYGKLLTVKKLFSERVTMIAIIWIVCLQVIDNGQVKFKQNYYRWP